MLREQQIKEIREHLENARNPIFLFDNDPDGLCSFLLLRRYCNKGRGVAIKSSASVNKSYFKRVEEFDSDYIFVLDKPAIDSDFLELAEKKNLTVVHLDHHPSEGEHVKFYYNPRLVSGTIEPTSETCYKITNRKEDLWIAVAGCVSDCFLPDFIEEFKKKSPELVNFKYKSAYDVLYNTDIGKLALILSFGLRDTTSNVVLMLKYLMNVTNPRDVLEENSKNKTFLSRFKHIYERYKILLEKAESSIKNDILYFSYSGEIGLNRDISNELSYRHPNKIIIIAYSKGYRANVSLRWAEGNILKPTLEALKDLDGATGGGHEHAPGAQMTAEQLGKFKENIFQELKKISVKV